MVEVGDAAMGIVLGRKVVGRCSYLVEGKVGYSREG